MNLIDLMIQNIKDNKNYNKKNKTQMRRNFIKMVFKNIMFNNMMKPLNYLNKPNI